MTLYKGIQGFSVQNLSADPTDPNEGQLWYNSTSNVWKLDLCYNSRVLGQLVEI
jgi:hypothetical protein